MWEVVPRLLKSELSVCSYCSTHGRHSLSLSRILSVPFPSQPSPRAGCSNTRPRTTRSTPGRRATPTATNLASLGRSKTCSACFRVEEVQAELQTVLSLSMSFQPSLVTFVASLLLLPSTASRELTLPFLLSLRSSLSPPNPSNPSSTPFGPPTHPFSTPPSTQHPSNPSSSRFRAATPTSSKHVSKKGRIFPSKSRSSQMSRSRDVGEKRERTSSRE